MHPRFKRLIGVDGFSIGLEFSLDNDWSTEGQRLREREGRPFGVPNIRDHANLAQQADESDFKALWVRNVPLYDPSFGMPPKYLKRSRTLGIWPVSHGILCWVLALIEA